MKFTDIYYLFAIACLLLLPGCGSKAVPTDVCKYQISVSDLDTGGEIDAIEFFDLAIEVSKDHMFPPPMKYDKNVGMLVFGHEDVDTMPGLKLVVYMWAPNGDLSAVQNICVNSQALETREGPVTENNAAEIVSTFVADLENRYREKEENKRRLINKYNVN
jgi:hypothetical protein